QLEAVEDRVLHSVPLPADRIVTPCCGRQRLSSLRRHFFPPPLLAPDASPICLCSRSCFLVCLAFVLPLCSALPCLCLAFVLVLVLVLVSCTFGLFVPSPPPLTWPWFPTPSSFT